MRYDLVVFDFEDTLADSASRVLPGAPEFLRDLTEAGLTLAILGTCGETSVRQRLRGAPSVGIALHLTAICSQKYLGNRTKTAIEVKLVFPETMFSSKKTSISNCSISV